MTGVPIDMLPITATWLAAFEAHRRRIVDAAGLLERWLQARQAQMGTLERRTRGFPVFAFEGRALSLSIDPQQHGALRAYGSAGAAWAAPFVAFGRGFTRIGQAVEDEWLLPDLIGAIERVFALVADSVDRLVDPRPGTFDPANARFSDVFGLFAMAWRGLTSSAGQMRLLAGDIVLAHGRLRGPATAGEAPGPTAAPATATPAGDMLDDVGRWLTGAIMLLPALPDWLETVARAAWLRARDWLLDTFQGIERRAFELRSQVLDFLLRTLPGLLREVPALVASMATLLQWSIRYFALVARIYFEVAVAALTSFVQGLQRQINGVIDSINSILSLVESILGYDLLQLIKPLLGPAGAVIDMLGLTFTLNDLIDAGTGVLNWVMYHALKGAIGGARAALSGAGYIPLLGRFTRSPRAAMLRALRLLDRIVDALFRDTGGPLREASVPRLPSMPNFYDLLFGASPADVAGELRGFGRALGTSARDLLERVSGTLDDLAGVFARTATDLARTGPAGRMGRFGREAGSLANSLYDDQIRALGERVRAQPVGAFERWLAADGFRIIQQAIPLYVAQMRAWWREQAATGRESMVEITPTSPHILARHARLGRVRVPRITLRAPGRAHDERLLRELAQCFREAVGEAYVGGQRQLAQIAGAAPT